MDREINLDPILALEDQIREHERATIQLKRTRNSLLNISTLLPPEILGTIFCWNAIPEGDFGGLPKGSYNFLLVCHHWFEVASRTPELWSFWGNSIDDWAHRHTRCGTGPLDLVLSGYTGRDLDDQLRDALQDRAARDVIRQVHLRSALELLNSVISSIVTEGEETRLNSVESLIVQNNNRPFVDISAFFSRYRLPKLRSLTLYGCKISSWDLLKSQTSALTTLELVARELSPAPTLPQFLSIIASNPLLQGLFLYPSPAPYATYGDRSPPLVPLRHLKRLHFTSAFFHAFWLLSRLELPYEMDTLILVLSKCSPSDLSQTLGSYLGDRVRRRNKFPGGALGLVSAKRGSASFYLCMGDIHKGSDLTEADWFLEVLARMSVRPGDEEADKMYFDLVSHIPRERVVTLETTLPILRSERFCAEMCNLTCLHLVGVDLSTWFAEPDISDHPPFEELLPRLDRIVITKSTLSGGDWTPLTNFLSRRAAVGNRISSLSLGGHPDMDEDVVGSIERVVGAFERVVEAPEDEGGE